MQLLNCGADTGFKITLPAAYQPLLLEFQLVGHSVQSRRIFLKKGSWETEHVYIIDNGRRVYQWNDAKASRLAKVKAQTEAKQFAASGGAKTRTLEESSTSQSRPAMMLLKEGSTKAHTISRKPSKMLKFLHGDWQEMQGVTEGNCNSNYVILIVTPEKVWAWVGKSATVDGRKKAMSSAHNFLSKTRALFRPNAVASEGREPKELKEALQS